MQTAKPGETGYAAGVCVWQKRPEYARPKGAALLDQNTLRMRPVARPVCDLKGVKRLSPQSQRIDALRVCLYATAETVQRIILRSGSLPKAGIFIYLRSGFNENNV
jgi:hypothetical protein